MKTISQSNLCCITSPQGFEVDLTQDGWFNATKAAEQFGKRPVDWMALPDTKEYLAALAETLNCEISSLLKTKRGRFGSGTWYHPKLAIAFARWLNKRFGVWCDLQIDALIKGTHAIYDKRRARDEAASSYKVMSSILQIKRQHEGKESKPCHFMNEAKLVNWVHSGEFASLNREIMTADELKLLAKLEEQNTIFIGLGMDYETRKMALYGFAQMYRNKVTTKLKAANCVVLPMGKTA